VREASAAPPVLGDRPSDEPLPPLRSEASGVARRRVVAAGDGGTREPRSAARIRPHRRPRQQHCRRQPQPSKCRAEIPV